MGMVGICQNMGPPPEIGAHERTDIYRRSSCKENYVRSTRHERLIDYLGDREGGVKRTKIWIQKEIDIQNQRCGAGTGEK
jgi:hypothetical protein